MGAVSSSANGWRRSTRRPRRIAAGGRSPAHVLVVTSGPGGDLRATARRWLRAAPRPTGGSYADSRPPVATSTGPSARPQRDSPWPSAMPSSPHGGKVCASRSRVPPAFPDPPTTPTRLTITHLVLEAVVGEADVERRIGEVTAAESAPLDTFPGQVAERIPRPPSRAHDRGRRADVACSRTTARGRVRLSQWHRCRWRPPPHPSSTPTWRSADPYRRPTTPACRAPGSLDDLRRLEDGLTVDLAEHGRIVAQQSSAGTRVLHIYVDGTTDAADLVNTAARRWAAGEGAVTVTHDPMWRWSSTCGAEPACASSGLVDGSP